MSRYTNCRHNKHAPPQVKIQMKFLMHATWELLLDVFIDIQDFVGIIWYQSSMWRQFSNYLCVFVKDADSNRTSKQSKGFEEKKKSTTYHTNRHSYWQLRPHNSLKLSFWWNEILQITLWLLLTMFYHCKSTCMNRHLQTKHFVAELI